MDYEHLPKEFEGIIEKTKYQAPNIDIEEDVKNYVEGVVKKPEEEREYLVKNFVDNTVRLALSEWKSKYRQNDEIIENIENHLKKNDKDTQHLNSQVDNLRKAEKSVKSEIFKDEKFLEDVERNSPKSSLNKRVTLYFLIIVAIGLAILTMYKFSLAMGHIKEEMSGEDLSAYQYILYGLGAFAILATAKIINVIYEKIYHSKIYFISIAASAVILSGFSVYSLASDQAFLNKKAQLVESKKNIDRKINRLTRGRHHTQSQNSNKLKHLTEKQKRLEQQLDNMKDEVIGLDKTMLILILFTEMLIGGTAWMYATDYSRYVKEEERTHAINTAKLHIEKNKKVLEDLSQQIKDKENEIEQIRLENHDLNRVLANIKTEQEIEDAIKKIVKNESDKALAYLWKISED